MKAGFFHSIWIILVASYHIIHISTTTIFDSFFGKMSRKVSDDRLRWMASNILKSVRAKVSVENPYDAKFDSGRPTMFFANHSSLFDIPIILDTLPGSIRMVAKKELFRVPIWGRGLKAGEFVSVDRQNISKAMQSLETAKEIMKSGIELAIFPEGTRSGDGEILPFKKGVFHLALQTNAIVVPVRIHGARDILAARKSDIFLDQEVRVVIGRPVDSENYSKESLKEFINEVREQVINL